MPNGTQKKKKKGWAVVLMVLAILIVLLFLTVYFLFLHYYNKATYVPDEKADAESHPVVYPSDIPDDVIDEIEDSTLSPDEEKRIDDEIKDVEPADTLDLRGIYSVLLIGSDRRTPTWHGNSDVMLLVTINDNTKTIYMTSFMRDLYANIPGFGGNRLNSAFALRGAPLLIDTIQQNYGVVIDNYAIVDFEGIKAIIDTLGGIDITLKEYELPAFKSYGFTEAKTYHMNGAQALTYARIRKLGYYDFERTSRHRTVLRAMLNNVKAAGILNLPKTVDSVLPYTTHNIGQGKMLKLMTGAVKYFKYDIVEYRVPEDKSYYEVNYVMIPNDMGQLIDGIRSRIYAR